MGDTSDFHRRLNRIPASVRAAAWRALVDNTIKMTAGMRAAVPKDKGVLAASIRMEPNEAALQMTVRAGGPSTTRPVREGADASYDYALAQEFGTEKMPANPFFWPTYRLYRKQRRAAVKRAMKKAAEKAFSGT